MRKILMKSPQVLNFTNIIITTFLYENVFGSFYVLTICVCNVLAKGNWRKSQKVKLTPDNFTNILRSAFASITKKNCKHIKAADNTYGI